MDCVGAPDLRPCCGWAGESSSRCWTCAELSRGCTGIWRPLTSLWGRCTSSCSPWSLLRIYASAGTQRSISFVNWAPENKLIPWEKHQWTHIRGDGCRLPPEEALAGGSTSIFNLVDDDSFGTNPQDDLSFQRLLLTHHTVEQYTVFRQLLTHLRAQTQINTSTLNSWLDIRLLQHLEELQLWFVCEHLSVVAVEPEQLPLDVRQGTFLHHAFGDILVRAVVVPPINLHMTEQKTEFLKQ